MSATYTDNTTKLIAQFRQRQNIFIRRMQDEMERAARPITPRNIGTMRQSIIKKVQGRKGEMIWKQPYSAPQERGQITRNGRVIKFRNYTTPGTGAGFTEKASKKIQTTAVKRKVAKVTGLGE